MSQIYIGKIIKETRIRLGYVQEDLCIGDLDLTTISRIESGLHIPHNSVIKKIFAQMDMRIPVNLIQVSDGEFERYQLQSEIEAKIYDKDANLDSLAERFRNFGIPMDEFDNQLYFFAKGMAQKQHGNLDVAKDLFYKAIKMTILDFVPDYDFYKRHAMHEKELRILIELAFVDCALGNATISEYYLQFLLYYTENGLMNENFRITLRLRVICGLCEAKETLGDYQKMLDYASAGISYCIDKDSLRCLSDFFYFKARAYAYKNEFDSAKNSFMLCGILLENQEKKSELALRIQAMRVDFGLETDW